MHPSVRLCVKKAQVMEEKITKNEKNCNGKIFG